jgi:murein DD-endopeptidase MepM/ murein hydrolase activator NlpD
METVRLDYDTQKQKKQLKQQELAILTKKLAEQKDSLTKQKQTKASLLESTKNDESKYQQLKKSAENELSSLLKAKFVGKRNVKAGDPLGLMGNTGYSFGDHLHFGLYNISESNINQWSYTNDIDPMPYINQHQWPMNNPINITQGRGNTPYSYYYADRFHHGLDLVSSNKTIKAVNEGVAYFYRNPGSSFGNHVKLFHPDGKMTLYLHMQ